MKNNLKYFYIFVSLFILLGLTGCHNFLELESSSSNSRIKITISGEGVGAAGSRTLFPSAPLFTKYELLFENTNGSNTYAPVVLNVNKSEVLIEDLATGEWEITAVGYITINGNFTRAADGTTIIEVKPWENGKTTFQSVNIPISAKMGTGNGTFSYSVDFPNAIHTAELYIYNIGGSPWDVLDENVTTPLGTNAPLNMLNNKSGRFTLGAGYYMMTMTFDNGYKAISWTEVIHIYANMDTRFDKIFDESYISGAISLSGNVSVFINGVKADWASIFIYSDVNYSESFSHADTNYGGSQLFPITMKAFDAPAVFYVKLNAGLGDSFFTRKLGSITLYKNDYVFNINENFQAIKAGGTSNITINGNKPGEAYIFAYKADDDTLLTPNAAQVNLAAGRNGAWEMTFEQFEVSTEIYFVVQAVSTGNSNYYKTAGETVRLYNSNRTNLHIELDVALLTVSGTANITVNGKAPKWASITMRKVTADQEIGDWLDSSDVDLNNGNAWRVSVNPLSAPITIFFDYACIDENNIWHEGKVNYQNRELFNTNITGIVFNIDIIIIDVAGTANISVYGKPPSKAYVTMYRSDNGNEIKNSWIDLDQQIENENGVMVANPNYLKWSMYPLLVFDAPTNVYFVISGLDSEVAPFERNAGTATIYNTDVLNISLNVNIIELTLSGTVTLTERFAPPEKFVEVDAMVMDGTSFTGMSYSGVIDYNGTGSYNWSIKVPSFIENTTMRFRIRWSSGGDTYFITPSLTQQVYNSDISGISLGTRDLYPTYTFFENTDYIENKQPRWTANVSPYIDRLWQSLSGGRVKAGEIYALKFTFTSTGTGNITELDAVIRDYHNDSLLSDIRKVQSDISGTLSGTIIFTIGKTASVADMSANALHFMADAADQPVLRFTEFYFEKINKLPSATEWAIKVNGNDDVLKITGPGVTTKADVEQHDGRDNVLIVRPGPGGYYHFVIEYDLSAWEGKTIRIDISFDYQLDELQRPPSRVSWRIEDPDNSYPLICQGANLQNPSTSWTSVSGYNTITVPASGKLYLSSYELRDALARFSNFVMTITE